MATTVEELRVKVTADTAQAEKGLGGVADKAKESGGKFSAAKAAVVGFATGGAVAIAGKLISAASDLNETVSKTGVVFGGQTAQVTGYAQKMADDFGLPKTAVLDAASGFGLLGQAAGVTGKPLADMSTGLTSLAADAMSFYNVPLEQALGDFTSALSGESEPVKKYGVLMNEAAVQAEALALGLAKPVVNQKALGQAQIAAMAAQDRYTKAVKKYGHGSTEAAVAQAALFKAQDKVKDAAKGTVGPLTEAMKVQARTSLLTKGLSKAHGDLARTQSSVSNQAKMLQGRVQNLAADMGAKLLPAASAVLGALIKLVSNLPQMAKWLKDNGKTIGIVAGVITTLLLPAIIQWGVQSTIAAVKSGAAWVSTQAKAIASSYAQIGAGARIIASWVAMGAAAIASGAETAAIWAMYQVEAAKGAAAQVAAQARVIASWVAMRVAAAVNAAQMAAAWVVGIIRQAAVAAGAMALSAARVVGGWVLMGAQSLIQAARMAAAWIIAMGPIALVIAAVVGLAILIYKNWDSIKAWTVKAWNAIVAWLGKAWENIKAAVGAALRFVVTMVTAQWRLALAVTMAVWNGIKSALSSALGFVRGLIVGYFGMYRAIIVGAWNAIRSLTASAWNGMRSAVATAVGAVLGVVRGIPSRVLGALGNLGGLLRNSGARIMQGLADGIWQGLGRVTGAIRGVLQRARNLLPFSPAKEGPFSGRGWTLYSGRSISQSLADGMRQQTGEVSKAALGLVRAAVPSVPGVTAPGVSFGASRAATAGSAAPQGLRPSQMADARGMGAGGPMIGQQNVYYPVAEKVSTATNRGLARAATLSLV